MLLNRSFWRDTPPGESQQLKHRNFCRYEFVIDWINSVGMITILRQENVFELELFLFKAWCQQLQLHYVNRLQQPPRIAASGDENCLVSAGSL
jgi:hypothetical protein